MQSKIKKAIYHLYNSVKRPQLKKYFERVIYHVVLEFSKEKAEGIDIDENDLNFIAYFYCKGLLGLIEGWLESGMETNFDDIIDKTCFLFDSNIVQAIELISKNKQ